MGIKSVYRRVAAGVGVVACTLAMTLSPVVSLAAGAGSGTVASLTVTSNFATMTATQAGSATIIVKNEKMGATGTDYVLVEKVPDQITISKRPENLDEQGLDGHVTMTFKKADGSTIEDAALFDGGGFAIPEQAAQVKTIEYRISQLAYNESEKIDPMFVVRGNAPTGEVAHEVTCTANDSTGGSATASAKATFLIVDTATAQCSKTGGAHQPDSGSVSKPATCSDTGTREVKCTQCGEVLATSVIPKLPHSFVLESGLNDPTVKECSVCHFPNPDYKEPETQAATASIQLEPSTWTNVQKNDVKQFTLTVKNTSEAEIDDLKVSIDALPDGIILTPGEGSVQLAVSNGEDGSVTVNSDDSGSTGFSVNVGKLYHEGQMEGGAGTLTVTFSLTCVSRPDADTATVVARASAPLLKEVTDEIGVSFAEKATDPETPPHTTHTWGEWKNVVEPTCTTQGTKQRSCTATGCSAIDTESIPALGHDFDPQTHLCRRCRVAEDKADDPVAPEAQMKVALTPAAQKAELGDVVTYTAHITQIASGADAGALTIEGKLSSGLRFAPDTSVRLAHLSQQLDASAISVRTDGFTITLPKWENADDGELTFQVTSADLASGAQSVSVTASPEKGSKDVATAAIQLPGETVPEPSEDDPQVVVSMDPGVVDEAKPDETLSFTGEVSNTVADTQTGRVTLTCELPAGLTVVGDSVRTTGVPQSVSSVVEYTLHGFAITLSDLPYGNRIGFSFDVTVDETAPTGDYVVKMAASPEHGASSPVQSTVKVEGHPSSGPVVDPDDPTPGGSDTPGNTAELKLVTQPASATVTEGAEDATATFTVLLANSGATLDRESILRFDCAKGIHVSDAKVTESTDEYPGSVESDFAYRMPKLPSGIEVKGTYQVTLDATTHLKADTAYPITVTLVDADGNRLVDPLKLTLNVLAPDGSDDDDPTYSDNNGGATDKGTDKGTGTGGQATMGSGTSGSVTKNGKTYYYASNGSATPTVTSKVASKMPQTGKSAAPAVFLSAAVCAGGCMALIWALRSKAKADDAR